MFCSGEVSILFFLQDRLNILFFLFFEIVGSPIERIYSAVFWALPIDDLEVEFIEELWLLYLSLVEIFGDGEIYEVLEVYINLHLMFGSVEVKSLFFKRFDDSY